MSKYFLLILFSINCLFAVAQTEASQPAFSVEKREAWIKEKTQALKKITPNNSLQKATLQENEHTDGMALTVEVNGKNILYTSDGGWIYFEAHSAHDNKEIGDITIAIDNKKNIYINEAHVCGGTIAFDALHFKEVQSAAEFFKHFTYNGEKGNWKSLE